ncbi:metallophosphoesterase [Thermodesulfatator indicus]
MRFTKLKTFVVLLSLVYLAFLTTSCNLNDVLSQLESPANETSTEESTLFVHFADVHLADDQEVSEIFSGTIPPVETVQKAVNEALSYDPDVLIQTGDIVALADSKDLDTGEKWFQMAKQYIKDPVVDNGVPFLYAPGNHDRAGIKLDNVDITDPRYDNGLIFKYIDTDKEKSYYSYSEDNYLFIMLDPEEIPETGYRAVRLPEEQLDWLKTELEANKDKFIIISYHQPLGSWTEDSYSSFMDTIKPYKDDIILVAGHTHDNRVIYRDGIPEYQDGAICGDWWQTGKTPDGNPMGYAIYYIKDKKVHRFYKGIDKDKQINLLSPDDVVISGEVNAEFNVYYKDKEVDSVCYKIDNSPQGCFNLEKIETPQITWYHATGTIKALNIDDNLHKISVIVKTKTGEEYQKDIVCKFSDEKIMPISEIINDENFTNFYGRFVTVDAVVTAVMYSGNLLTLQDDTGSIVVWAGDCHHPEFQVGDKVKLRGQVTQFKGTKELKLVSSDDVEIYGHEDLENQVVELENIKQAYEQYDSLENKIVKTSGVITAVFGNLVFIQDDTQGIALWLGEITAPELYPGQVVTVQGGLSQYKGMVEIVPLNDEDLKITGEATVPEPKVISLAEIDQNYGTLVKVENLQITSISSSKIVVTDGDNSITIYCGKAGFDPSSFLNVGDNISVTGVVGYYYSPQIYPRSVDDIIKL